MLESVLRVTSSLKINNSVKKISYQSFDFFPSLASIIDIRKTNEDGKFLPGV